MGFDIAGLLACARGLWGLDAFLQPSRLGKSATNHINSKNAHEC